MSSAIKKLNKDKRIKHSAKGVDLLHATMQEPLGPTAVVVWLHTIGDLNIFLFANTLHASFHCISCFTHKVTLNSSEGTI